MHGEPELRRGAAVLLIDRAGRVLLQQRDDDVPPAGYGRWAIPGRHIEPGEGPREAAIREFREETAVALERVRFFGRFTLDAPTAPAVRHELHLYFADDPVEESAIEVHEGLDFRFWSPEEARSLPMNSFPRAVLEQFFASDHYRGTLLANAPVRRGAAVLVLDSWGKVLLQLRDADLPPERHPDQWSLPGGLLEPGEAPDAAALREFEEETGHLLEELRFYRTFTRTHDLPELPVDTQHVYFIDAAIPEAAIDVREGQAFRYFAPQELETIPVPPHSRAILAAFFASPAYRGLFH